MIRSPSYSHITCDLVSFRFNAKFGFLNIISCYSYFTVIVQILVYTSTGLLRYGTVKTLHQTFSVLSAKIHSYVKLFLQHKTKIDYKNTTTDAYASLVQLQTDSVGIFENWPLDGQATISQ